MKTFVIVLIASIQIIIANTAVDSLRMLVEGSEGARKVDLMIQLADEISHESRQEAIPVYLQAVDLARALGDTQAVYNALYAAGDNYYNCGRRAMVFKYMRESFNIAEELNDSSRMVKCLLRIGNAYAAENEQEQAEQHYLQALALNKSLDDPVLSGRILNNLANLYNRWGQYVKALNMYDKVQQYYETAGFTEGLGWLNFSIALLYKRISDNGNALKHSRIALQYYRKLSESNGDSAGIMICYGQLGDIYINVGELDSALEYHQAALRLRQKTGVKPAIADGYRGMGEIYYFQKDYTRAMEYFQKALKLRRDINYTVGMATLMKYIGLIHLEQGDLKLGRNYLQGALALARKGKQRYIEKDVLGKIAQIYLLERDFEQATTYFKQYMVISDSVANFEVSNKITSYLIDSEIEKRKKETELLSRENRITELELAQQKNLQHLLITLSILVIIILFGIMILYRIKSRDNQRLMIKNSEIFTAHQRLKEEIEERKKIEKERETLIEELKDTLSQIKALSGLIPICANCKKIRNDDGYYEQLEKYIMDHSEAVFSHGICPECMQKLYPDLDKDTDN